MKWLIFKKFFGTNPKKLSIIEINKIVYWKSIQKNINKQKEEINKQIDFLLLDDNLLIKNWF